MGYTYFTRRHDFMREQCNDRKAHVVRVGVDGMRRHVRSAGVTEEAADVSGVFTVDHEHAWSLRLPALL